MTPHASNFNNPVQLSSLEEIAEMDRQREQAIEAIEISDDGSKVRCQHCRAYIAIVGKLIKPKTRNDRIGILEKRISYLEKYPRGNNNAAEIS